MKYDEINIIMNDIEIALTYYSKGVAIKHKVLNCDNKIWYKTIYLINPDKSCDIIHECSYYEV